MASTNGGAARRKLTLADAHVFLADSKRTFAARPGIHLEMVRTLNQSFSGVFFPPILAPTRYVGTRQVPAQ